MSAEDVVSGFLSTFETQGVEAGLYLADNMTLHASNPPLEGGKNEFIGQGRLILEAMPDFRWGVQQMTTQGNRVTVKMRWSGTQTGHLPLSQFAPDAPDLPPTNKKVAVPDTFVFTVSGNQITRVDIASEAGEGFPEFMRQLGIPMPPG